MNQYKQLSNVHSSLWGVSRSSCPLSPRPPPSVAAPVLACASVVGWGATSARAGCRPCCLGCCRFVLWLWFRWFVLVVCLVIRVVGVQGLALGWGWGW